MKNVDKGEESERTVKRLFQNYRGKNKSFGHEKDRGGDFIIYNEKYIEATPLTTGLELVAKLVLCFSNFRNKIASLLKC